MRLRDGDRSGAAHDLRFEDRNYPDRLGWREVTAAGDGATIVRSDVSEREPQRSTPLLPDGRRLPRTSARHPLAFRAGRRSSSRRSPDPERRRRRAAGSSPASPLVPISRPGLIALMIAAAVGVGAIHALGPGHGKSLIGAYLIGAGGTLRQAAAVGAAVSVMHTASVLGLGLLVLSAERVFAPERVYPWLGLASGLVALGLGAALLVSRIHALSERRRHGHDHPHPDRPLSRRGLVALAFAGRDPAVSERAGRSAGLGVDRPDRPRTRPDRRVQRRAGGVARRRRRPRDPRAARRDRQASRRSDAARARGFSRCIALVGLALTGRGLLQI